jgi:mono/diheme cytochrome c family protein
MKYVVAILMLAGTVLLCSNVEGSDCYARGRAYYAPYVAPLVTYYPPTPAAYVPAYSASYGLSPEGLEILKMVLERDAQREAKYDLLLQKMLENGMGFPKAAAPKHLGLTVLNNACASCHDSARVKPKGDFGFLKSGVFVDEGDNLPKVLDAIDVFGPKAKDGRAFMPPSGHPALKDRDAMAVNSYLNRLPPPEKIAAPKKELKKEGDFP